MTENPKYFRIYNGENYKINIQWEPRDIWIGCFWRITKNCLHIYICIIPCLPFHITKLRRMK